LTVTLEVSMAENSNVVYVRQSSDGKRAPGEPSVVDTRVGHLQPSDDDTIPATRGDDAEHMIDEIASILAAFVAASDQLCRAFHCRDGQVLCDGLEGLVSARRRALAMVNVNGHDPR
jgi:hypothetical protein